MAKYRVIQMTLTATHNGSAELTVNGDTARVFARYSKDELGNKVYYPGCSPHELMCEYVAGINRACQAQAW